MRDLMEQYQTTAKSLYSVLSKTKYDDRRYRILLAEYQHACSIYRQLLSYCKTRGIL